ncbi:glycosyltransferase family 10 domain-containing protein [Chloroflexota bacterium]
MQYMYLVCQSTSYYQNRIFDLSSQNNRDDCYYPFYLLQQRILEHDMQLNTYDYLGQDSGYDYKLLFFDVPRDHKYLLKTHQGIAKYLVIFEPEVVSSVAWNRILHGNFTKVFTWNDALVDNKKYVKLHWPNKIPAGVDINLKNKTRFCVMIVGHKSSSHPLELYSERTKAIGWFEQNHPEDFDLYGVGWDKRYFKGALSVVNRLEFLNKYIKPKYPSYRGTVKSKREVLQKYKFSICYENARDVPGYITEKIFDCFFAGCVPIYRGASNIAEYIPADTFIDMRNYATYDELYSYLKSMSANEYMAYLVAIKNYVECDKIYPFSAECFADTIINNIEGC